MPAYPRVTLDSPEIKTRAEFGDLLNRRGLTGEAAEIGVHLGEFADTILSRWTGRTLHLVDPRQTAMPDYVDTIMGRDRDADYEAAMARLSRHEGRFQVHRSTSLETANRFADNRFDFVYIDANHAHISVLADVFAWWPKVRSGGILAGHDWANEWKKNVRRAVYELTTELGLTVWVVWDHDGAGSWYVEKP